MKKVSKKKVSKRTAWLAYISDHGDRLVEIAQEHSRLARQFSQKKQNRILGLKEASALIDRIDALKRERNEILKQFEG